MSDNKKYYYLKLKDNFFDSEEMIILQNMQDGYLYSDILFKMYLRSLKNEGKLMFNDMIPYTPEILSQIVRHNVGVVEKGIDIFNRLGLIEIMDNGAIYMMHIQNYIGHSSSEADRQREYQKRIKDQKQIPCKKSNRKTTPEKKKEKEKEKEIICNAFKDILNIWNSKQLPKHKDTTFKRNIKKRHKDILNDYGVDEISKAIDNYNIVVNSDNYWYSHTGTLWQFLNKYIDNFVDSANPLVNYKNKKQSVDNYELL